MAREDIYKVARVLLRDLSRARRRALSQLTQTLGEEFGPGLPTYELMCTYEPISGCHRLPWAGVRPHRGPHLAPLQLIGTYRPISIRWHAVGLR